MSGTISIESEPDVGTEVSVDIPLRFEKVGIEAENLTGKRILVMEADPKLSERYRDIFGQFNLSY